MNVYVVVDEPCCNGKIEVLGVYNDRDEAWQVAEDWNGDSENRHAAARIHDSILIGRYDD